MLRNISSHDAQCLRAASEVGVFPTRVIPGFIETFCVAALEYEALGVPVLASAIGGVPEATPDDRFLVAPGRTAIEWLARIDEVLTNRAERSAVAAAYAGRFTSARSAQRLIDLADLAADRLNRPGPAQGRPGRRLPGSPGQPASRSSQSRRRASLDVAQPAAHPSRATVKRQKAAISRSEPPAFDLDRPLTLTRILAFDLD